MYQSPKKHNIKPINKIYHLLERVNTDSIYLDITFSINPKSLYYDTFIEHSKEIKKLPRLIVKKDIYEEYLEEESKEDIKLHENLEEYFKQPRAIDIIFNNSLKEEDHVWYSIDTLLNYNEELGIFKYKEYFINTPAVRGIIEELKLLKNQDDIHCRTYWENSLLNCLESIDKFWD